MRRAYTLAEVLITLSLVGVIAVLTLPALMNNINKSATVAKLKSAYSILAQSFDVSNSMYGNAYITDKNSDSTSEWFSNMLSRNLHVVRYCADQAGCWNGGTHLLDGTTPYFDKGDKGIGDENTTFVTSHGYMINMDGYRPVNLQSKMGIDATVDGVVLYVDINGAKKPNTVGRDVFVLTYTAERGMLPAGADRSDNEVTQSCKTTGYFCLERIVRDGWSADNLRL